MIGLTIFVLGFLWLVFDLRVGFGNYQYTRGIWQMQHLPAGKFIPRSEAEQAFTEFGVALKDRQQKALLPAFITLIGGLLFGFAPHRHVNAA